MLYRLCAESVRVFPARTPQPRSSPLHEWPSSAPQHSCGYVSSPCARRLSYTARGTRSTLIASSQNRSLRYFSAESGSTVTITACRPAAASSRAIVRQRHHRGRRGDADQQPLFTRQPLRHLVGRLGLNRNVRDPPAADRRSQALSPSPCASTLRARGTANPAATRPPVSDGFNSFSRRVVPMNVPLVPSPATKCVTAPAVCSQISRPVESVMRLPVRIV